MDIGYGISGATFSDLDKKFRYALWRIWDMKGDKLLFIGLNPSTANENKNDATITRLVGFAKYWGFGGLFAGNLFSYVTANPVELCFHSSIEQPNGPNDVAINTMRQLSSTVMVGWGNYGKLTGKQPYHVLALLGEPVYCLKITKAGEPAHPLYFPKNSNLIEYKRIKAWSKS